MPKLITKKLLACGFEKSSKLIENLEHYKQCSHEGCKLRAKSWEKDHGKI